MVAIPQSGLLSQVSSFRMPLGHSGPILTLSNAAHASLPSPCLLVADAGICAASPLGVTIGHVNLWVLIIYLLFLPVMLPSMVPRLATDLAVRVFPCVWKPLFFKTPLLGRSSVPTSFVSHFVFYIFFLPPFEDNGLLFWVPDVLCRHSEVVLWNLLSVQMFF